jgi:hypothetical protein
VREVGDRHREVALAEVDADREAGAGVEGDQRGRAPAARRPAIRVAVHDHALRLQPGDDRRHGRAREARVAGDVGAARDSEHLKCLDHPEAVLHRRRSSPPPGWFVKGSAEVSVDLALICSIPPKRPPCPMLDDPEAWYWVS